MPAERWRVNSGCFTESKLTGLSWRYQAALKEHPGKGHGFTADRCLHAPAGSDQ
jgi:hypothetical protein